MPAAEKAQREKEERRWRQVWWGARTQGIRSLCCLEGRRAWAWECQRHSQPEPVEPWATVREEKDVLWRNASHACVRDAKDMRKSMTWFQKTWWMSRSKLEKSQETGVYRAEQEPLLPLGQVPPLQLLWSPFPLSLKPGQSNFHLPKSDQIML